MITSRRSFLTGLGAALVTAPAIVRATSLMPIKQMIAPIDINEMVRLLNTRIDDAHAMLRSAHDEALYIRYSGYEPIGFDAERQCWKSPDELSEESRVAVRAELFDLKN